MSDAYAMISESLNEIIEDLEKNDGKNLNRETLSIKFDDKRRLPEINVFKKENFLSLQ